MNDQRRDEILTIIFSILMVLIPTGIVLYSLIKDENKHSKK